MMPAHDALTTWAIRRHHDLHRREGPASLLTVGPDKPLGAMGFGTSVRGAFAAVLAAMRMNFRGMVVDHAINQSTGIWLYAYDYDALNDLLLRHSPVLWNAGWPDHPSAFVTRSRVDLVNPGCDLFDLIAEAYGDVTNPGRLDVLPGVPRAELLAAYQTRFGRPDPEAWRIERGVKRAAEGL